MALPWQQLKANQAAELKQQSDKRRLAFKLADLLTEEKALLNDFLNDPENIQQINATFREKLTTYQSELDKLLSTIDMTIVRDLQKNIMDVFNHQSQARESLSAFLLKSFTNDNLNSLYNILSPLIPVAAEWNKRKEQAEKAIESLKDQLAFLSSLNTSEGLRFWLGNNNPHQKTIAAYQRIFQIAGKTPEEQALLRKTYDNFLRLEIQLNGSLGPEALLYYKKIAAQAENVLKEMLWSNLELAESLIDKMPDIRKVAADWDTVKSDYDDYIANKANLEKYRIPSLKSTVSQESYRSAHELFSEIRSSVTNREIRNPFVSKQDLEKMFSDLETVLLECMSQAEYEKIVIKIHELSKPDICLFYFKFKERVTGIIDE